jgi:hypothetical protein
VLSVLLLLAIVLSVLLLLAIVLSVLLLLAIVLSVLRFTDSDYLPLVSSNSFQGYVGWCPTIINSIWIKLFYFILEVASIDH